MSDASRQVPALLGPAVTAARAALRRLEPDEVPASLRRVAAYSGGRLPPPLAQSLLEALDENEWLRSKSAEELEAGDGAAQASRLFLNRPAGWALQLAEAAAAQAVAAANRDRLAAERKAGEAEERLAESRRRLRDARDAVRSAPPDDIVGDLRRRLKAAHRDAARSISELEAALRAAETRLEEAAGASRARAAEAQRLRAQVRQARRERAALEAQMRSAAGGSAGRWPSLELARRLDETARLARPAATPAPGPEASAALPALPPGVRPDSAEAVDWLVSRSEAVVVLVDGYNVTFALSDRGFETPDARNRLNDDLARLATVGRSLRVVVVYDSDQEHEGSAMAGPGGIEVVFAPADRLADEELVARAAVSRLPAVVVSTDREVREGAEEAGALALWGEALVAWIRRRS